MNLCNPAIAFTRRPTAWTQPEHLKVVFHKIVMYTSLVLRWHIFIMADFVNDAVQSGRVVAAALGFLNI
jgi:hypothetical protein